MHKYGNFSATAWVDDILAKAEGHHEAKANPVEVTTVSVAQPMPLDPSFSSKDWAQNLLARAGIQLFPNEA
ncbi:MAG: hypothetical protein IJH12_05675 [Clostridia bacterium]|nr:hypothetical protein [Clostridia bacterium]